MENFKLGDRIKLLGKNAKGELAFVGNVHFSEGAWFGIILDEAKGKNDGSVDGTRYFKCVKNHGVFVRPCHVKKDLSQIKVVDGTEDNEHNNVVSSKIPYPNYLKASSKLKLNKHTYESKSIDIRPTKLRRKFDNNHIQDSNLFQDTTENDPEWKAVKEENEILMCKLKSAEESLKDTLIKYNKAMEEIKSLKIDLDCKQKQIKVQKCHLKLLKMRQCNHYKNTDSCKVSSKNSNQKIGDKCSGEQATSVNGDMNNSDDEFDLESLKALCSMQRVNELEEQNRLMVEGLVELRESLKSVCQSQIADLDTPKASHQRVKYKTRDMNSFLHSTDSSVVLGRNSILLDQSASQIKDVLQEMRKFSEIKKQKRRLGKEFEGQNLGNIQPEVNCKPTQKDKEAGDSSSMFHHNSHLSHQELYFTRKNHLKSNTERESFQNPLIMRNNSVQNYFPTNDNRSSTQSFA